MAGGVLGGKEVLMTSLNEHITCSLCRGYLVDATSVTECLHSYCRSCILRHLECTVTCPKCDVIVKKDGCSPKIRRDKTLQDLVYKLVPGLFQNEMKRRREFVWRHKRKKGSSSPSESKETTSVPSSDSISVCIQLYDRPPEQHYSFAESADTRYLCCPAAFTIGHLNKFITMKFGLNEQQQVCCFYLGERLPEKFTLEDVILMYGWTRITPLRITFTVFDPVASLLSKPVAIRDKKIVQKSEYSLAKTGALTNKVLHKDSVTSISSATKNSKVLENGFKKTILSTSENGVKNNQSVIKEKKSFEKHSNLKRKPGRPKKAATLDSAIPNKLPKLLNNSSSFKSKDLTAATKSRVSKHAKPSPDTNTNHEAFANNTTNSLSTFANPDQDAKVYGMEDILKTTECDRKMDTDAKLVKAGVQSNSSIQLNNKPRIESTKVKNEDNRKNMNDIVSHVDASKCTPLRIKTDVSRTLFEKIMDEMSPGMESNAPATGQNDNASSLRSASVLNKALNGKKSAEIALENEKKSLLANELYKFSDDDLGCEPLLVRNHTLKEAGKNSMQKDNSKSIRQRAHTVSCQNSRSNDFSNNKPLQRLDSAPIRLKVCLDKTGNYITQNVTSSSNKNRAASRDQQTKSNMSEDLSDNSSDDDNALVIDESEPRDLDNISPDFNPICEPINTPNKRYRSKSSSAVENTCMSDRLTKSLEDHAVERMRSSENEPNHVDLNHPFSPITPISKRLQSSLLNSPSSHATSIMSSPLPGSQSASALDNSDISCANLSMASSSSALTDSPSGSSSAGSSCSSSPMMTPIAEIKKMPDLGAKGQSNLKVVFSLKPAVAKRRSASVSAVSKQLSLDKPFDRKLLISSDKIKGLSLDNRIAVDTSKHRSLIKSVGDKEKSDKTIDKSSDGNNLDKNESAAPQNDNVKPTIAAVSIGDRITTQDVNNDTEICSLAPKIVQSDKTGDLNVLSNNKEDLKTSSDEIETKDSCGAAEEENSTSLTNRDFAVDMKTTMDKSKLNMKSESVERSGVTPARLPNHPEKSNIVSKMATIKQSTESETNQAPLKDIAQMQSPLKDIDSLTVDVNTHPQWPHALRSVKIKQSPKISPSYGISTLSKVAVKFEGGHLGPQLALSEKEQSNTIGSLSPKVSPGRTSVPEKSSKNELRPVQNKYSNSILCVPNVSRQASTSHSLSTTPSPGVAHVTPAKANITQTHPPGVTKMMEPSRTFKIYRDITGQGSRDTDASTSKNDSNGAKSRLTQQPLAKSPKPLSSRKPTDINANCKSNGIDCLSLKLQERILKKMTSPKPDDVIPEKKARYSPSESAPSDNNTQGKSATESAKFSKAGSSSKMGLNETSKKSEDKTNVKDVSKKSISSPVNSRDKTSKPQQLQLPTFNKPGGVKRETLPPHPVAMTLPPGAPLYLNPAFYGHYLPLPPTFAAPYFHPMLPLLPGIERSPDGLYFNRSPMFDRSHTHDFYDGLCSPRGVSTGSFLAHSPEAPLDFSTRSNGVKPTHVESKVKTDNKGDIISAVKREPVHTSLRIPSEIKNK